jgi:replicative DNA helicase
MQDKLPPQNREAEEAVLGSILMDQEAIYDVAEFLKADMFYVTVNRWIYESILRMHGRNNALDIITLGEELRRNGQLEEVGGEPYLVGLVGVVPNSLNVESYGRIVEGASIRRDMLRVAGQLAMFAYDEAESIDSILDKAGAAVFELGENRQAKDLVHIGDATNRYIENLEKLRLLDSDITGLPTGLNDLDNVINGLNGPDLVILAARPGMGKTALNTKIVSSISKDKTKKVAMFSLEMSDEQVVGRMAAAEAGINLQSLARADLQEFEWNSLYTAIDSINKTGIFIDDSPTLSPMQLRTKCRRLHAEHGLDLITVDYIQLMKGDDNNSSNRVQEVGEITRGLKNLARELGLPIVALAQLSRGVESRQDKRPMLSDLRDSGSIEQDADIVMFIYRDDYYNPETSERPNIAEISIAKHRNGPTSTVDLYWNGASAEFNNLRRSEVQL